MEKKTAEEILREHYSFCDRGYCEQMPHINEMIQIVEEYSSLQSEEKDKEIEGLRGFLKRIKAECLRPEEEGDPCNVTYIEIQVDQALSNQPIESDKDNIPVTESKTYLERFFEDSNQNKIDKLNHLLTDKDRRIKELEEALKHLVDDNPNDSTRIWVFRAFTTEQAYRTGRFFDEREFSDFNEMKTFSAQHSAVYKKAFPNYCSTYFDKVK